jgi:hypothetical protein
VAKSAGQSRSARQRQLRQRRGERVFLIDSLWCCVAEFEHDEWESALALCGGDVVRAARECGVDGVAPGTKALWGRSVEEAVGTYRRWQKR